ncbi:MAG: PDZ domain-containing protein, partial [Planctomycetota bacterium]
SNGFDRCLNPFKPVEIGVTVRLTSQGVEIKEVRNKGPADQAGILPGQIINAVHSAPIKSSMELRLAIAATPLGQTLDVQIVDQEGQILKNSIEVIPKVASIAGYPDSGQDFKSVVKSEVRLPDYSNQGFVIFPSNQQAMGLLVWLAKPGPLDLEKLTSRWTPICKKYPLAILVLESTDPKSWQSVDSEVIRAMVENLASMSSISPDRILIGSYGTGGTMASRVAFSNKSVFRGLILDDAMFSNQIEPGSPDPLSPMPILILGSSGPTSRFQKNLESNQFIVLNKSSIELVTRKAKDDFIAKWSTLVDRL